MCCIIVRSITLIIADIFKFMSTKLFAPSHVRSVLKSNDWPTCHYFPPDIVLDSNWLKRSTQRFGGGYSWTDEQRFELRQKGLSKYIFLQAKLHIDVATKSNRWSDNRFVAEEITLWTRNELLKHGKYKYLVRLSLSFSVSDKLFQQLDFLASFAPLSLRVDHYSCRKS